MRQRKRWMRLVSMRKWNLAEPHHCVSQALAHPNHHPTGGRCQIWGVCRKGQPQIPHVDVSPHWLPAPATAPVCCWVSPGWIMAMPVLLWPDRPAKCHFTQSLVQHPNYIELNTCVNTFAVQQTGLVSAASRWSLPGIFWCSNFTQRAINRSQDSGWIWVEYVMSFSWMRRKKVLRKAARFHFDIWEMKHFFLFFQMMFLVWKWPSLIFFYFSSFSQ